MRSTLGALGLGEVQLQQFGAPDDVLIRIAEQPGGDAAQQEAVSKVRGALGNEVDYRRVEVVGPRVSGELLSYGVIGLGLAIFCILIYLWFRFEWQFALGAMIANVHDIVLTIGFMSITQIDFDLTSIAALLTILGYSLNDTVVIYDRIREMLRRYKKLPMPDLLNASVNQTLSRSVITHVTVSLALLSLLLFGGQAIHSFTATMMFGVVLVGTYTSVFIASPILIYLGVGTGRRRADRAPARRKTTSPEPWPAGVEPMPRICRTRCRSMPMAMAASVSAACRTAARCCACRTASGPGRSRTCARSDRSGAGAGVRAGGGARSVSDRRRARPLRAAGAVAGALSRLVDFGRLPGHRAGGADLQYPAGRKPPRRRGTDRGRIT